MAAPTLDPTPERRALRWVLLAVLCAGAASCVPTARNPFAPANTPETQIFLDVENRGFNDIRLYVVSSRGNQSLGAVEGNTRKRMTVPWRQLDQISFRIEVLAGRSYNTHAVTASPGDVLELIVPEDPSRAILQVR